MKKRWIIGTRSSKLALKQTEIVVNSLEYLYPDNQFLIKTIKTTGDTIWNTPLNLIGGKGLFVTEIEEKLLNKEIDMAVHSMKDLPTELKEGLTVGAVLKREDPRDVFISLTYESIKEIKNGSRIGTSSLRRKAQILHYNNKIEVVPLRGNVDTRIKKIKTQSLDGVILAYAGVKRMGFEAYIKEILPLDVMIPSSGQGAIGIEIRNEDGVLELIKPMNHEKSFYEVSIERKLQSKIGGGCHVPLGIHARLSNKMITVYVALCKGDGEPLIKETHVGSKEEANELISKVLKIIASR